MNRRNNVCPGEPLSKDKFQTKLAAAWGRVWPHLGSQTEMAARMKLNDTAPIKRVTGMTHLPEAHTIFNSLCADLTALNEVFDHYGLQVSLKHSDAANDLITAAGTIDAMAALIRALDDRRRDHTETLVIADLLRPHMAALNGILREADEIKGRAA